MTESGRDGGGRPFEPETWLRGALDAAPIGVLVVDRSGTIRAANPQAHEMYGYDGTSLIGRSIDDLIPERLHEVHHLYRAQYMEAPHARAMGRGQELRARRRDGSELLVEIGLNPLKDGDGMVACTVLDVTMRALAQDALREQHERQRVIVDNIADGVISVDENGLVTAFNRAAEHIFGHHAYDVIGRPVTMLMAKPMRQLSPRALKRILANRAAPMLEPRMEVVGQRRDGTAVLLKLRLNRSKDENGLVITGIVRDISERRQQEAAVANMKREKALVETELRATEGTFRDLIDRANVVPYTWDLTQQRFLSIGPRARALLGYDESEWMNVGFWERVTFAEDWSNVFRALDPHDLPQTDNETQYRMAHRDGHTVWVRDVLANEQIGDGQHIIRGFLFDVTDARQRDMQMAHMQKMDAVGQLTGGIAHDFNNLLAVVIGNLDMLVESADLPQRAKELVELSLNAALRGADLTRQMLAFSQQQDMRAHQVSLGDVIMRMVRLLQRTLGEHYEINNLTGRELWDVFLDSTQFETAILNLALNARDAMKSGGTIAISAENTALGDDYCATNPSAKPGEYVCVSVSDTGEGIAPEILDRVFDPYFTTKTVGKGTGLGLSMIYGFVKQSGGHVKIYSERGHGTTVRLYLPRYRPGLDKELAELAADEPQGGGQTILCVEDDAQVRQIVRTQLQDLGYKVLLAETGPMAMETLRQQPGIALLFTDVIMPGGMFGADLAEAARKERPDLRILFTSGFTGAGEQLTRVLAIGPLITKPYRKIELAQAVRDVLSRDAIR